MVTADQRTGLRQTPRGMLPARLASVLAQNHTRVLDLFRAADANADGEISHSELSRLLRKLGVECSQVELAQLFETLDPDRSGGIEYHELQRALRDAAPPAHSRATNGASKAAHPASRPEPPPHLHQGPPTAFELRVLEEMINEAAAAMAKRAGSPGGMINLVRVLSAYEVVLQRHGLVPVEDTRYYHLVLQMSLLPQPDWRAKTLTLTLTPTPPLALALALTLALTLTLTLALTLALTLTLTPTPTLALALTLTLTRHLHHLDR